MRAPASLFFVALAALAVGSAACTPPTSADPVPAEPPRAALRAAYVAAVQERASPAHRLEPARGGFVATSAAAGIRAELSEHGVLVRPARGDAAWTFGAHAARFGCPGELAELGPAAPEVSDNRAEYARGPLRERYVNGPLGIEQGFTLPAPPPCARREGVEIALDTGTLRPIVAGDGREARLLDASGREALRYTDLHVVDAAGRLLPAGLTAGPDGLSIRIDDGGAVYPVEVDPLMWAEQAELVTMNAEAGDALGTVVAIDGDTAVAGAPLKDGTGAAYVFVQAGGAWTQEAELAATDGLVGDSFGASVAISADSAVIGAPDQAGDVGGVYVFTRTGTGWTQQVQLGSGAAMPGDGFGTSVAVSGDTLIAGAPGASMHGAAYVFVRSGGSWFHQQALDPSDGAPGDEFGASVGLDGDTAVMGAPQHAASQGAAYVFVRSSSIWTQQQELLAPGGQGGDTFGSAVALSSGTAVVGAPGEALAQGAAYVFVFSAGAWPLQQQLTAADGAPGDLFGGSIGVSGDTAIAGAQGALDAAYVFARAAGAWTQQAKLTASDGTPSDEFGLSVAVSGTNAVVGAPGKMSGIGTAYAFHLGSAAGDPCTTPDLCATGFCVDGVCCTVAVCIPLDDCHVVGTCQAGTGLCSNPDMPDGTPCDDHDPCTAGEACQAGACVNGSVTLVCPAGPCTLKGSCDPTSGACAYPLKPDGTTCDDGSACTRHDVCQTGVCTGEDPVLCTPPDACHDFGDCDPTSGACFNPAKADGLPCPGGVCMAGVCATSSSSGGGTSGGAGCGCGASGAPAGGWMAALGVLLLARRRRA